MTSLSYQLQNAVHLKKSNFLFYIRDKRIFLSNIRLSLTAVEIITNKSLNIKT